MVLILKGCTVDACINNTNGDKSRQCCVVGNVHMLLTKAENRYSFMQ